jgi:hypothetical protein
MLTVKYIYSKNINSVSATVPKPYFTLKKDFIGLLGEIDVEGGPF